MFIIISKKEELVLHLELNYIKKKKILIEFLWLEPTNINSMVQNILNHTKLYSSWRKAIKILIQFDSLP